MKSTISKIIVLVAIFSVGLVAIYLVASNTGGGAAPPVSAKDEGSAVVHFGSGEASEGMPAATGPQPRIQFEEVVYDWGAVYQNEKVPHIFTFKNVGQGELVIEKVKSS